MRFGVLFSGGKDSTLAMHLALKKGEVVCLITIISKNKESYMFHTPNIEVTKLQAQALGLPQITIISDGKKEEELCDLKNAIIEAKKKHKIEGVVTGAIESVYQSSRIERVCSSLGIQCFNPLWKYNQKKLLENLIEMKYEVIISGVFAYPLDEKWLGKQIDNQIINKLVDLNEKYGVSPSGEGGEIETTVLDAPLFKQKIEVIESESEIKGNSGVYLIKKAKLVKKIDLI